MEKTMATKKQIVSEHTVDALKMINPIINDFHLKAWTVNEGYAISMAFDFNILTKYLQEFEVGEVVEKCVGDYTFIGPVVSKFLKLDGTSLRYVAEDDRGILHVFSQKQLRRHTPNFVRTL
jgi:hypothetical protein